MQVSVVPPLPPCSGITKRKYEVKMPAEAARTTNLKYNCLAWHYKVYNPAAYAYVENGFHVTGDASAFSISLSLATCLQFQFSSELLPVPQASCKAN